MAFDWQLTIKRMFKTISNIFNTILVLNQEITFAGKVI